MLAKLVGRAAGVIRLTRVPIRFFADTPNKEGALATKKDTAVEASHETPVYLKPYDAKKYEVPSTKLKYSSGYAMLDVEPFPRSKIMKLCYIVLDKLKIIPETAMYRIYTEEKMKYIMTLTDKTEDIRTLEETFGHDSIEVFIQSLHGEVELVDLMFESKPWIARTEENEDLFKFAKTPRETLKHQKHVRPDREPTKFIESGSKQ